MNQVINKGAKETKPSKHKPQTANNTRECSVSLAAKGTRGKMIPRFRVTLASMLPLGEQATMLARRWTEVSPSAATVGM